MQWVHRSQDLALPHWGLALLLHPLASSDKGDSAADRPAGANAMRKMEVREVWKIEMAAIRTDVTAIKAGFDDFKTAIAAELATLSSSMSDTECSLTVCSDDVDFLKREVRRIGTLTDSL